MDPKILAAILRNVAVVAADPALGYRGAAIIAVLQLVSVAIEAGVNGHEELTKLQAQIEDMVLQGREPTKAEWAELKLRSQAAHDVLNPPEPELPEA